MDIPINKLTDQIDPDATHDIFCSIQAMDTGISNHEVWISQVHQSLICQHGHSNPADLCEDAHCRCKFGQWLYSPDTEVLKAHDSFHSVVEKHQQMHALARKILKKSENKQDIAEDEYRDFTSQAIAFKLEVRNLQYMLMSQVCVIDHLTGAWNRYAMYSKLHEEKERLARTRHSCTLCMMDIDYFKRINDEHGHTVGDKVLKAVIGFCRASLRKYDSIYRYGGEEFLFCLPDVEQDEARIIIERLCVNLGKYPIPLPNGESLSVTASFGIACMQNNSSVEDTIQSADHALLCAKAKGRARVCCWEDGLSTFK
ncbi:MAG: diguanylate cyclase [Gammaproteobacteria bacterium]|nr:diguanylate cyclase [Gammaproteobacteria bacterium]